MPHESQVGGHRLGLTGMTYNPERLSNLEKFGNLVSERVLLRSDADSSQWNLCVLVAMDKFTWTTESCGEKGTAWPLSQEESASTLALTGFYCFSGHSTLSMVFIYFVQVRFRRLQKTKERVLLIT